MSENKKVYRDDGSLQEEYWGVDMCNCHRENGPAYILYTRDGKFEYIEYAFNDMPHRVDGPAMIWYDTDGNVAKEVYCLLGWRQTKENMETPGYVDAFLLGHS